MHTHEQLWSSASAAFKNGTDTAGSQLRSMSESNIPDATVNLSLSLSSRSLSLHPNGTLGEGCHELNCTDASLSHVPPLSIEEIVQTVTLSILFLLSLTGNSVALIKITRNPRQLRHSIYQLMLQLIVADLFVTFFCLLGDAIHKITVNWYADDVTCRLFKLLGSFAQFLSSYIVALVAVNRALVVIKPMLSPSKMKKIMQYLITAVWIFSLLMSIPQVIIWRKVRGPYLEEFYDCTTMGYDWTDVEAMLHACIISSFIFIVPLLIMAISFCLVIRTLAKTTADQIFDSVPQAIISTAIVVPNGAKRATLEARPESRPTSTSAARSTFYSRAKLRSQRMSLQITIWYTACWVPYIIVFIAMSILRNEKIIQEISRWCIFFGQTNCIINPIIYASFHIRKHEAPRRTASRTNADKPATNHNTVQDCCRTTAGNGHYTALAEARAKQCRERENGHLRLETQINKQQACDL